MNKRTVINHLDPRAGLWLLLMANIGMFCQKNSEQGSMLSCIFLLLMLVHGLYKAAGKGICFTYFFPPFTNVCISAVPRMDEYGVSSFS